ncbi:unnamed protein product [Notodromas monacha]|uniref:18 kDa Sin3-associated polypeptide n=1 Tax=Notodromas monacha TaxID=399045 RepID=A0A7R9BQE6_9CRUS|nr:unnamed protein product [Notodromas monacha]CAG0918424.1 unnamed protein product [Notodromas monacha]
MSSFAAANDEETSSGCSMKREIVLGILTCEVHLKLIVDPSSSKGCVIRFSVVVSRSSMRRFDDRGGFRGGERVGLGSMVEEVRRVNVEKPVNREKTCPMLLRLFYQLGRHHSPMDYAHGKTPLVELQIYTWMDASLRELTMLITEVNPDMRRRGTSFEFKIVSAGNNGYRLREIGSTISGMKGPEDAKTLSQSGFVIGDYLDICITPAQRVMNQRRPRPY